jgi:hypothetical protein
MHRGGAMLRPCVVSIEVIMFFGKNRSSAAWNGCRSAWATPGTRKRTPATTWASRWPTRSPRKDVPFSAEIPRPPNTVSGLSQGAADEAGDLYETVRRGAREAAVLLQGALRSGCWWYPTNVPSAGQLRIRRGAARGATTG